MGKKIGIASMICTIIFVIFGIIEITQAPEIPEDVYELMVKDQEAAQEIIYETYENVSTLYKVADKVNTIAALAGIVLAIVSIVKLVKAKEKGKVIPILSIVIIVVFYFAMVFSVGDMGAAFQAGLNAGMEMAE